MCLHCLLPLNFHFFPTGIFARAPAVDVAGECYCHMNKAQLLLRCGQLAPALAAAQEAKIAAENGNESMGAGHEGPEGSW